MHSPTPDYLAKLRFNTQQPATLRALGEYGGKQRLYVATSQLEAHWLTQALIAELFQTTPQNITLHLKALYAEGELSAEATCKDSRW